MAKLNELEKYLGYEFSSGCYTGQDYITFQNKYINYLRSMCKKNGWELVNIGRNHYCFTCFIKTGKKYVYLSISDVRYFQNEWYYNILVRSALHERDYTGGSNQYTKLPNLEGYIANMFERNYWLGVA